jgi:flavin-dependent dehydrogenase
MAHELEHGTYDVIVAGGGPAGSVTAICLARLGWRVALAEASAGESVRYGETLPPECNPLLRRLGLWSAFERSAPLESPGILCSWGQPNAAAQDFLSNAHGAGWHVDRARFDAELRAEASREGVAVLRGASVKACVREPDCWRWRDLRARVFVDASGRNGLRLDGAAEREIDDSLLALVLRISHPAGRPRDLRTQIAATPWGWWYWAPVPDGSSVAMFFTNRQEYARVRRMEGSIGAFVDTGRVVESRWIAVSSSLRKILSGDGWIAIGDSASSYDPLSGRGIFKAIRHASLGAEAVDGVLRRKRGALDAYEARVRGEFREYIKQRRAYYALERRWPSSAFWSGRQK